MNARNLTMEVPLRFEEDGAIRIGNSRVLLELVIQAFTQGASADKILRMYDALSEEDLYSVLSYYIRNRTPIDQYVEERNAIGDANEQRALSSMTSEEKALRERLLAERARREREYAAAST